MLINTDAKCRPLNTDHKIFVKSGMANLLGVKGKISAKNTLECIFSSKAQMSNY